MDDSHDSAAGRFLRDIGDWADFSIRALAGLRKPGYLFGDAWAVYAEIGFRSVAVVVVTGSFLGMVLAMQAFSQFHQYGFDSALGAISIGTILGELGPVLAAVMLAGRVGGSMAAELGTMRITEQTDALACLGVDPVMYLATPRFFACLMLIPLLTVFADVAGIAGSTLVATQLLGIDSHHYWEQTLRTVRVWDVWTGLVKSMVFGGLIALVSCYQGFNCRSGAQGVGRAATQSFVVSFLLILMFDFLLVYFFATLRPLL